MERHPSASAKVSYGQSAKFSVPRTDPTPTQEPAQSRVRHRAAAVVDEHSTPLAVPERGGCRS
jgi:hypothetical protein